MTQISNEFEKLQELVECARNSLPALTEQQSQELGCFLLAALWLGRGKEDYITALDKKKPHLFLVK